MGIAEAPAVGIDLGTTFSVIAHLDSSGRPCTIPNSEGDLLTPSAVFFDGQNVVVGKEAVKAAVACPDDIAQFVKREMGNSAYGRPMHGEYLPPEVIESFVLEKLRRDASLKLGEFSKVVISVPAFFNEPRRKATQDAGSLAGLEVLNIINEPTAAAIAYGVQEGILTAKGEAKQKETILVYDLGGGTFDVTVMEIDGKNYTAIATAGDVELGGIDWDRRIVDFVAEAFAEKNGGVDPRKTSTGFQRLLREAEDAKRTLTARDQTTITFEHEGRIARVPITRQQFEEMTADLLDRTRFTTTNLIQDAGLKWDDLTRVLVVGGLTRMPMVLRMLKEVSGRTPDRCLSADEAVAHGAAIYAGFLLDSEAGEPPNVTVRNVNSHNLGVLGIEKATERPRTRVMIPRNTALPASKAARFVTHRDGQANIAVRVVEGGDASGNDATHIGKCVIRDLPPGLPAGSPVEVEFQYGDNGRLTVKARLPDLDKEAISEIERASGLTAETLREWNQRLHFSECAFRMNRGKAGAGLDRPAVQRSTELDGGEQLPMSEPDVDEPPPLPLVKEEEPPPLPRQRSGPTSHITAHSDTPSIPSAPVEKLGQAQPSHIRENEIVVKEGRANLQRGIEAVGGKLYLTDRRLVFEAHKFNIQSAPLQIELGSVVDVRKCWTRLWGIVPSVPNSIAVTTKDGTVHRFVVWGRESWIVAIEGQTPALSHSPSLPVDEPPPMPSTNEDEPPPLPTP